MGSQRGRTARCGLLKPSARLGVFQAWDVTEYALPTSNSEPSGITVGPDGALWFTESGMSKIGRITTAGDITEYPRPSTGGAGGITAGPDGALWFTEYLGDKIGRITTAGYITEYPVPTAFAWPAGIAAGPDGALWFAESNKSKIGRITTAGDITEYAVPQRYRPRWNHGGAGRRTVVYSRQRL